MYERTQGKARQLHCDWCTIQCPDSQWWYLWWVCHPLACLSVEFSVGFPIECPTTSTFTACISVWGTSKDLFLTDTNVKSHLSSWRCQGPVKLGVPKPVVLIGIYLVYHLHRAWFAQERRSGSHLIGEFLAIWTTNFVEEQLSPWSYQVLVESVKMHERTNGKARRLHCDLCAIQCPDSQWWSLWRVCHPLACLSVSCDMDIHWLYISMEAPAMTCFLLTDCQSSTTISQNQVVSKYGYHKQSTLEVLNQS